MVRSRVHPSTHRIYNYAKTLLENALTTGRRGIRVKLSHGYGVDMKPAITYPFLLFRLLCPRRSRRSDQHLQFKS